MEGKRIMVTGLVFWGLALALLGAWSTTKIPMLMFEYANLGARFTFTRLAAPRREARARPFGADS